MGICLLTKESQERPKEKGKIDRRKKEVNEEPKIKYTRKKTIKYKNYFIFIFLLVIFLLFTSFCQVHYFLVFERERKERQSAYENKVE